MAKIILGLILILIGLSALIAVSFIKLIFAIILIIIGIKILSGRHLHHLHHWSHDKTEASASHQDFINEVVIFGPLNKTFKSENFKGGKVVAIFSGGEIDISGAKTSEKNVNLEFVAIFSGVKLIIPKNWKVNSQGTAILGGYNNRVSQAAEAETILNIKGAAIFGGVEISN